jgi:hypothetical protein
MALPLLPIAVGIAGTAIGGAVGSMFGGSKKEEHITTTQTYGQVYHSPYETFAPQIQYAPQTGYAYTGATYIIDSPGATSKKETLLTQESSPAQAGTWDVPQSYETRPTISSGSGIDNQTIMIVAALAAAAIVGYGLLSGGKK